jgi:hypothetical protein
VYLEGSEVDNAVNLGMLRKDVVQSLLVRNIGLVEDGALPADQLNAVERNLGRIVEVIDYNDIVIVLQQGQRGERADIPRATAEVADQPWFPVPAPFCLWSSVGMRGSDRRGVRRSPVRG